MFPRARVLTLASYLLLATSSAVMAQDAGFKPAPGVRSIAITATDRVTHMADVGTVTVGYQLFAPTKDEAYSAGSRASNAIVEALEHAGVPKEAIQSQSQGVSPHTEFDPKMSNSERAARAFEIQQSWTVRTNAADAARVLDLAVKAGANNSGNIEWSLRDPNAAQAEAAGKALQRARTQAQAMAGGLTVKLGNLLYASNEVNAGPVRPVMQRMRSMAMLADAPAPLAINPREIETVATVYAVFAIE